MHANSAAAHRPLRTPLEAEKITRLYPALRGLLIAPIWAFFAVSFFIDAFTSLPRNSPHHLWPVIPAVVASVIVRSYLNRTYGVVRTVSAGKGVAIVVTVLVAFYIVEFISLATVRLDLTGLAFGLMALAAAVSYRGFRRHWLVPAAIAILQPFVFLHQTPDHLTPAAPAWWGLYWTACTLASLWDHHLLVRSFNDGRAK